MNLLLFTVELERSNPGNSALRRWSRAPSARRASRYRWIALVVAAVLCAAAAALVGWAVLGGGSPFGFDAPEWLPISTASAAADPTGIAQVQLTSDPDNATVLVDGHERGKTPLSLRVVKGTHTLMLLNPAAVDDQRQITVLGDMHVSVSMLWRRPEAQQLKPAYPGANISGAAFLADGRLALSIAVPGVGNSGGNRRLSEAWVLDAATGSLGPFSSVSSPRAPIVAVSPDGTRVAYAQPVQSSSTGSPRLTDVLVAHAKGSLPVTVFTLPAANADSTSVHEKSNDVEEVNDLTWTPDGRHLLVIVRLIGGYASASRSRLLLVDADPAGGRHVAPVELLTLPADVVAGSYNWAADGTWVAFLTSATTGSGGSPFLALCAVDTAAGGAVSGFRYVADLGRRSDAVGSLPVAQVAWSPVGDGRLVFAGATPKVTVTNPLGLPTTSGGDPGLFVATPTGPALTAEEGRRLGSATGLMAPAWSTLDKAPGGDLFVLARSSQANKPLTLRDVDPTSGAVRNLDVALPPAVGGSGAVAARWDLAHGRLLVIARHDNSNSGLLDYWLVQLRAPAE